MYSYFGNFLFIFIFLLCKCQSFNNTESKFVLNVRGNSDNLYFYYITLFMGNKKQNQSFIIDTTSSITTSPCSLCESCGDHLNEYYIINDTSSIINADSKECNYLPNIFNDTFELNLNYFVEKNCKFFSEIENEKIYGLYLENSVSFESILSNINNNDNIEDYISEEDEFQILIGCSLKETGFLQSSLADGIIGLNNNNKSFVSMLYRNEIIKNNLFSLCLDRDGGYLSLGEIDTKYHICPDIKFIAYNESNELYELEIEKIIIKDIEIKSNYKSILNSASTLSYFPELIFNNISMAFFAACSEYDRQCGKIKRIEGYGICSDFKNYNDSIKAIKYILPIIKINFKNYEFNWEPKDYALNYTYKSKIRICFGIDTEKNLNKIIFGSNFMHGHDIIFDRENGKIGFCEASCGRNISEKNERILNKTKKEEERAKIVNVIKNEIKTQIKENNEEENNRINNDENLDNDTTMFIYNKDKDNNNKYYKYLIFYLIIIFILFAIFIFFNNVYYNNIESNVSEQYINNERINANYKTNKDINEFDSSGQKIELIDTEDNNN